MNGVQLFASPSLSYFLSNDCALSDFEHNGEALRHFVNLDDNDIWSALKVWSLHSDKVLSLLSNGMVNRKLFKIEISQEKVDDEKISRTLAGYIEKFGISANEARYFISSDVLTTDMYSEEDDSIDILYKDGAVKDISQASDMLNIELLSKKIKKYYFAYVRI